MKQIAVIALTESEHVQLLQLWKFFPQPEGVVFHHLYPGSGTTPEKQAGFLSYHPLHGDERDQVENAQAYLAKNKISLLVFSGAVSYHIWTSCRQEQEIDILVLGRRAVVNLSRVSQDSLPAEISRFQKKATTCVLGSEAARLAPLSGVRIMPSYQSWQTAQPPSLLLTQNGELCSLILKEEHANCLILHPWEDSFCLDLGIDCEKPDFEDSLNRLLAAQTIDPELILPEAGQAYLSAPRSYSFFAKYYDAYMFHVNYEQWLNMMLVWYRRFTKGPLKRILELACGTAKASEILVCRGLEVDACDRSPHMLHVADAKPCKPNLYLASLTDPIPGRDYDLIFCLFDSINYLTRKAEIKTLLDNCASALRPGGIFIFDISTLMNSLQNFDESVAYTKVEDGYIIHASDYESLSRMQLTHLTLFRRNGNLFSRFEERHQQRVYSSRELVELIEGSSLRLRGVFSSENRNNLLSRRNGPIDMRYARLFYVLQKD